jgi:hypothetical protein
VFVLDELKKHISPLFKGDIFVEVGVGDARDVLLEKVDTHNAGKELLSNFRCSCFEFGV